MRKDASAIGPCVAQAGFSRVGGATGRGLQREPRERGRPIADAEATIANLVNWVKSPEGGIKWGINVAKLARGGPGKQRRPDRVRRCGLKAACARSAALRSPRLWTAARGPE